mgnify:CR=1 FL=1
MEKENDADIRTLLTHIAATLELKAGDVKTRLAAVRTLASWVKQCHIKDANRTQTLGTWGEEVPSGTGQVDWKQFFAVVREIGFTGHCCIEREAGTQRVADIITARKIVEALGN